MDKLDRIAADVLGVTLRPAQRRALEALTGHGDTLAVLPTGSGKSAIYQVGGLALGGLTVVVSPLIALQRDQLRSMTARDSVRAVMLNSSQHHADRADALAELAGGRVDFVMLGPEQLANAETMAAITGSPRPITLVAVDEAHLVSEWGHDFRPEYLRLADVVEAAGRPPVLALTATAAPPVQADITRQLRMRDPQVIVADFDRPNISLAVRRTRRDRPEAQAVDDRTVEVVLAHEGPALVYALSHARCESLAERLRLDAYRAEPYHAGLPAARRSEIQDAFFAGRLDVVVATSAFGMGIDKPDVRTVVHAGVPGSLDEYYQEIGRAGRDGHPATAVLVYDPRTVRIPRLLAARSRMGAATVHAVIDAIEAAQGRTTVKDLAESAQVGRSAAERVVDELLDLGLVHPDGNNAILPAPMGDAFRQVTAAGNRRQAILRSRIESARGYAETTHCRRADLLAYFGEHYTPPCGSCDNDKHPTTPAAPIPPARAAYTPATNPPPSSRGADSASSSRATDSASSSGAHDSASSSPVDEPASLSRVDDPAALSRVDDSAAQSRDDQSAGRAYQTQAKRVRHRLWGPGTLLSQDDHELVVAFDSVGYRHLVAAALTNGLLTLE
ncbi:RecQ family ATP-dependent DNA helicase [Actinoplanes sp. NPDC048796]|uniref:RecQ family ATP-dependent DNA helicase n=1 Tax=Actinoplanes sp. NPDC048796 TaxID=3155640 RepID=UPI0033F26FE1